MLRRAATLVILAMPLAACGDSEFKQGFDEGFDKSWKKSFVKSCVKGAGPRVEAGMAAQLCDCIAGQMQEKLTRAELSNPVSAHSEEVGKEATDACVAKLVKQGGG